MPAIDVIIDRVISETGAAVAAGVVKQKAIDTIREFCLFTGAMSVPVSAIVPIESVIAASNYGSPVTFTAPAETEPCGVFGLRISGRGVACIERDITTPLDAMPVFGNRELFFKFSGSTCIVHPLQQGGDIRMEIFFRPTVAATQITDSFWDKYADIIMMGIKASVFMMAGYKFSNPQMAVSFLGAYESMKKKARGNVAMKLVGVSC